MATKIGNVFAAILFQCLPFAATSATAQRDGETPEYLNLDQSFGLLTYVHIELDDQIEGRCWTNLEAVKSRAKLKFEQNDIQVIDYRPYFSSPFSYTVVISGLGLRTSAEICVGEVSVQSVWRGRLRYGGANNTKEFAVSAVATSYDASSVFVNSSNLNDQISDFVDGAVSELVAKVISARRDPIVKEIKRTQPGFLEKPMSQEEVVKMIEELRSGTQ